jgi:hypothetical protein
MSHIVSIRTRVTDALALAAACRRLGYWRGTSLPYPSRGCD